MMHATAPVDELLTVVAEPTRARIVAELARESLCTCHLVEILGAGQTAVSNHLRVLRLAGVVDAVPAGRFTYYELRSGAVAAIAALRRPGLLLPDRGAPTVLMPRPSPAACSPRRSAPVSSSPLIVGSGIAASRLSPDDTGLQLLQNSTATALGLTC